MSLQLRGQYWILTNFPNQNYKTILRYFFIEKQVVSIFKMNKKNLSLFCSCKFKVHHLEANYLYILLTAFLLDLIFGDPKWLPHLIVLYGNSIAFFEKKLNKNKYRFTKGMLLTLFLVVITVLAPFYFFYYLNLLNLRYLSIVISSILLFYCLANKTLIDEGKKVFKLLKNKGVEAGRKQLSYIVGRDTSKLTKQQIRIAVFETMSENLSDGVIAPLFYFALFGIPGAMGYKMINTLDSMIGYKSTRYIQFGKFAAKLDDVANYIPARVTAFLILLVTFKLSGIVFVFNEGKKHTSPNAGYPEAALAYVLNCRFGGPNIYYNKLVDKPFIGNNDREIHHQEIKNVSGINMKVSILFVLIISGVYLWI